MNPQARNVPPWFTLTLIFWFTWTSLYGLARWGGDGDLAFEIGQAVPMGFFPACIYAWALSNRPIEVLPRPSACALHGIGYGILVSIVTKLATTVFRAYFSQLASGHIRLGHLIALFLLFVVPWLIVRYATSVPGGRSRGQHT